MLFIGKFKRFLRSPFLFEHTATLFFDFDVEKVIRATEKNKDLSESYTYTHFLYGILFIRKQNAEQNTSTLLFIFFYLINDKNIT